MDTHRAICGLLSKVQRAIYFFAIQLIAFRLLKVYYDVWCHLGTS